MDIMRARAPRLIHFFVEVDDDRFVHAYMNEGGVVVGVFPEDRDAGGVSREIQRTLKRLGFRIRHRSAKRATEDEKECIRCSYRASHIFFPDDDICVVCGAINEPMWGDSCVSCEVERVAGKDD